MSFAVTVKDAQDLRRLIPLNILSASRFEELCAKTGIEEVARGAVLFNQGDAKNEFVYVLSGTVSLQAGGMEMETITGGTESARFALAHQIPRKVSAIAKDRVRYIKVDSAYVNQPSEKSTGSVATYEVSDMPSDAGDDWVTTLLKSPIFQRLPPANLQNILSLLEEVGVRAGQEIIHQDEPGDYYYVIKRGRCALTRKPSRLAREIKLAELKTTDTFGEDALISDQPRNVTVTMMTDGILLRLNKANFLKLVKEPVISFVNMDTAQRMLQQGARWLDVRAPDSFDEGHLPGAVNIPFFRLRMELTSLGHQFKYILVCETGKVSEAAAFLLIRYEFDAYVLKGGISGVFKDQLVVGSDLPGAPAAVLEMPPAAPVNAPAAPQPKLTEAAPPPEISREIEYRPEVAVQAPAGAELGAIKTELADLKGALDRLQGQASSLSEAEAQLRDGVVGANDHFAEAENLAAQIKDSFLRLQEQIAARESPAASAAEELTQRLEALEAENQALERRAEGVLQEAEERLQRQDAVSRKALTEAQALIAQRERGLEDFKAEIERLRAQLQQAQSVEAKREDALDSAELERIRQDKDAIQRRNQELEQQVAELGALVQEFVEQQGEADNAPSDGLESLRAELDMVRAQADQDVLAMQRRLRDGEQESARLRAELDAAQQRLLMSEAGLADAVAGKGAGGRLLWVIALCLGLVAGAGGGLAFVLGTEAGKALISDRLAPPANIQANTPVENSAPEVTPSVAPAEPPVQPGAVQ